MNWLQALLLGLVQGLTEFLPVSSSGHLAIGKAVLGVEPSQDLMFEVTVHAATVLATIVVFRKQIWKLLCGLFKFKYNDETDYIAKICLSMIPVLIVGVFFKDAVEAAFNSLLVVGIALLVTALLLTLSDCLAGKKISQLRTSCSARNDNNETPASVTSTDDLASSVISTDDLASSVISTEASTSAVSNDGLASSVISTEAEPSGEISPRNGISLWQAFVVGIGQALAVIPGLSRSGTTISTGLLCGVKREAMAQFSFLMVLVPILGEMFLDVVGGDFAASSVGVLPLLIGFLAAFASGLFACKVMIALVRKAKLKWFGLYCAVVGLLVLIFLA